MTPAEAFKFGFLAKCAADGCSPEEITSRIQTASMQKQAIGGLGIKDALGYLGSAAGAIGSAGSTALTAALVAPPVLGGLGGYALAKANTDDYDPKEAVKREEIENYYRAIQQLAQAKKRQKQLQG